MSLGNNRDYKTADRRARKNLKRHAELMRELMQKGIPKEEASRLALAQMDTGSSPRKPEMTKCACPPNHDARTCFELRHYGYSPAKQNEQDREDCECSCHSEYDETE